jgi:hypothetical protein
MHGTMDAAMMIGWNEKRSATRPIRYVEIRVPIPAPVPLNPLTDATARVWNTSAGSARKIVEQAAYANVENAKSETSST